jgi:nucleotide-binding universal stress UspA family protein
MFHRILVGVDDSSGSAKALERAIELVQAGHGRLGLLSSAPAPPPLPAAGPVVLPVSRRQLEQQSLDWAQRNLDAAVRAVPQEVPVTKLLTRGAPGAALLREARSGRWDLVVVGQGHRRPRLPLVERVGDRLNRRSPTPVLVVHEDQDEPRGRRRAWRIRSRRRRLRWRRPEPLVTD